MDPHGVVPEDVRDIVAFLNTVDVESGKDELSDGRAFGRWLDANGWPASRVIRCEHVEAARALRDALRAAIEGDPVTTQVLQRGTSILRTLPIGAQIAPAGPALVAAGSGSDRFLAQVGVQYITAVVRGRFGRIKLCASPDCRWAFWDSSRNGSRRWCAMQVCGARSKMRSLRERQTAGKNRRRSPARSS